ncbi:hypothetical protein [Arhodomonas sp. SL1]|uniref:hypothetical protein n=1 Tax=Arhodomonas sp. SL1 TaxID=3425691 RepID=UPI003F885497
MRHIIFAATFAIAGLGSAQADTDGAVLGGKLTAADIQAAEGSGGNVSLAEHFRGDAAALPAQRLVLGGHVLQPAGTSRTEAGSAAVATSPTVPQVGETLFGTLSTVEVKGSS